MYKKERKHIHDPSKFKFGILKYSMTSQQMKYKKGELNDNNVEKITMIKQYLDKL